MLDGGSPAAVGAAGTRYPHILLQASRSVFTSVALPLAKPA
jgi:hypothetical protein